MSSQSINQIENIGRDWLVQTAGTIVDQIDHYTPSQFAEKYRKLSKAESPSYPGPFRFEINPFMREIVDCFDPDSPVREVNLKKGVQITYTTALECGILYGAAYVGSIPMMYITADKELAQARIENNVLVMLNSSGLDVIRSADIGNNRKTGKTKNQLQFHGGGYLVPWGAINADKMRQFSILMLLKDEIDAWPLVVGRDGDPDLLTDDRCSFHWELRKIFRGSTPLLEGSSKIEKQYKRGDQRKYYVHCLKCGYDQYLWWDGTNKETGRHYGMEWDYTSEGMLDIDSVRYACQNCGHGHTEYDKEKLFDPDNGAEWRPTATPVLPNIRSYHLPALYSPPGMQPWYKCVSTFLDSYDPKTNRVIDAGKYQVFRNNILAETFKILGSKVSFGAVSAHRRRIYHLGELPQAHAREHCGHPLSLVTCTVDVHHSFLAVAILGWTRGMRSYIVDYIRLEDNEDSRGCEAPDSPVWSQLQEIIETKEYDGIGIAATGIDTGWASDTVANFCAEYASAVYPLIGRDRPAKSATIKEFSEFVTQAGQRGYKVNVDHYKERLSPVLRRMWDESQGEQREYHFNAPVDLSDKALKELTVEYRKEETDTAGNVYYKWYRPQNSRNELWDLLVYGHALVEIVAWEYCTQVLGLTEIDWDVFWTDVEAATVGRQ